MATFVGRETTTSGEANVASLVHTYGSAVAANELLIVIAHMAVDFVAGEADVDPTGYTELTLAGGSVGTNNWEEHVYYKFAAGTETTVTIAQSAGSSPMIAVVYRFRLSAGESWAAVSGIIADNTSDTFLGDAQSFLFTAASPADSYVGVSYGLLTGRDNDDQVAGSYSYTGSWTDTFPGTGTITVLSYGVTSNNLDSLDETALWDGRILGAVDVPNEDFTWNVDDADNFLAMWARMFFPITGTAIGTNQNRFTRRRFSDIALPYDLRSIRLGG